MQGRRPAARGCKFLELSLEAIKNLLRPVVRPLRRRLSWFAKLALSRGPLAIEDFVDYFALRHARLFFVQVGACDGVANDPIHRWVKRRDGWSGLLVEPVAENMRRLRENYRGRRNLIFEQSAVAERAGRKTFYLLSGGEVTLPAWTAQLGSFDRRTLLSHRAVLPDIERYLVSIEVEALTLEALLRKHAIAAVDLLLVDCEGYDFEVLRQIAGLPSLPRVLLYEHAHLPDRRGCQAFLAGMGYGMLQFEFDTLAYQPGVLPKRLVRRAAATRA